MASSKTRDQAPGRLWCQTLLDERARQYIKATAIRKQAGDVYDWRVLEAAGWQDNDDQLYTLADAVSKASGDK